MPEPNGYWYCRGCCRVIDAGAILHCTVGWPTRHRLCGWPVDFIATEEEDRDA